MDGDERVYRLEDPEALRALTHPLRGRLLLALRLDGPATASALGRRFGESSGATSYHLRILARYGFVEDDPDRPRGRERWWRAAHDLTTWEPETLTHGEDGSGEIARQFLARLGRDYARQFAEFVAELDTWPSRWQRACDVSDRYLRLTPERLEALTAELNAVVAKYAEEADAGPDAERVAVILQAFPQRPAGGNDTRTGADQEGTP